MLLQNIFWLVQELLFTQREDTQSSSSSYKKVLGIVFTTKEQTNKVFYKFKHKETPKKKTQSSMRITQHMQAVPPVWAEGRRHPE